MHKGYPVTHKNPLPLSPKLIDVKNLTPDPKSRFILSVFQKPIEKTLAIRRLNAYYDQIRCSCGEQNFYETCLTALNTVWEASPEDLKKIPSEGALVVVANHPFGGIEGVVLAAVLNRIRTDVKIMGNYLLRHIPEMRSDIIPVDPFNTKAAPRKNLPSMKQAVKWIAAGGALITFPSGEVSHLNPALSEITDPPWSKHLGFIIRKTKATVLPVYFPGQNGPLFQFAGLLHPRFRTLLLPRAVVKKANTGISLYIGKTISWKKLDAFKSNASMVNYLRAYTYLLKYRDVKKKSLFNHPIRGINVTHNWHRTISPIDPEQMQQEIFSLPPDQRLVQQAEMEIYHARVNQAPNTLIEIGRLREITFREVGEGTGRSVDLDEFDDMYEHLFMWNRKTKQIVGAYRIGRVDKILKKRGLEGLYTWRLFRFKRKFFFNHFDNALEIGRSFIRSEHQKKYSSLLLLWRGIGEFIVRNPRYRILFGPVSISQNYHVVSKNLMIRFLKQYRFDHHLSEYVKPRTPFRFVKTGCNEKKIVKGFIKDIDDVSFLISEIEEDGKGVPVLIRQYLKINASFVGFNIDKSFSNVVDGLVKVDLKTVKPKLLKRFMGDKGFESYQSARKEMDCQSRMGR